MLPHPTFPTIRTTYAPIAAFRAFQNRPTSLAGLSPLDCHLIALVLELLGDCQVIDGATSATEVGSTLLAATQPKVKEIQAVLSDSERSTLDAWAKMQKLALPAISPHQRNNPSWPTVVLLHTAQATPSELCHRIRQELQQTSQAVILLLGTGPVGQCQHLEELLPFSRAQSFSVRLFRELAETCWTSEIALIASSQWNEWDYHLQRIQALFTGNSNLAELLWERNRAAIAQTDADSVALRSHPKGGPIFLELEQLREAVRAKSHIDVQQHATMQAELNEFQTNSDYIIGARIMRVVGKLAPYGSWRRRRIKYFFAGFRMLLSRGPIAYLRWLFSSG